MHVIGHYRPGSEPIKTPAALAIQEGIDHHPRDTDVPQPHRSESGLIHLAVQSNECPARRQSGAGASACQLLVWPSSREGASQTPRDKQEGLFGDIGMPVREPSAVKHSELAGGSACPTL